ncbi:hypothetical protein AJ87_07425 [Rhizobium yanglingense]|nr:hypothetical protein AJ87_07425 [Rhizobium yanglingense]
MILRRGVQIANEIVKTDASAVHIVISGQRENRLGRALAKFRLDRSQKILPAFARRSRVVDIAEVDEHVWLVSDNAIENLKGRARARAPVGKKGYTGTGVNGDDLFTDIGCPNIRDFSAFAGRAKILVVSSSVESHSASQVLPVYSVTTA